jgi:sporulation protein YlmC with PRC-barrel domain
MKPDSLIKLVSELLDLPLYDVEGKYCGIVDDVELGGGPGKDLKLTALLVGPGAYAPRLPGWAMWTIRKIAGDRITRVITRVPMEKVHSIGAAVHLECSGWDLGLHKSERRAAQWVPHEGAL